MEIKKFNDFTNESFNATKDEEKRFRNFVIELTKLSKKYAIAIESTGGVRIFPDSGYVADIQYGTDATSGDLEYTLR